MQLITIDVDPSLCAFKPITFDSWHSNQTARNKIDLKEDSQDENDI